MVDLAVINIPPRKLPGGLEVQEVAKIQDAFLVGEKYSYLCQKPCRLLNCKNILSCC